VGEKTDEMKGRAKEAVGDLTDDERLKREGKVDRAGAKIKGAADDAKDKLDEGVDTVKRKVEDAGDR
jgi:uncharacterized protein YjbJ (UPF0337 family)